MSSQQIQDGQEPLNIIIPIGGIGSRFAKQGYRYPKPLVNIVGRPMILWLLDNLSVTPNDIIWVAINEEMDEEFHIGQLLQKSYPKLRIETLKLRFQTRGAAETV